MASKAQDSLGDRQARSPAKSHTGTFLAGAALGVVAGVGLGIVGWALLYAAFGVLAGAAGLMTAVAVGAVGMGLYEGNQAVKRHAHEPAKESIPERVEHFVENLGKEPTHNHQFWQYQQYRWQEREHQRQAERQHQHHHDL